jgi:hypothetical protein
MLPAASCGRQQESSPVYGSVKAAALESVVNQLGCGM